MCACVVLGQRPEACRMIAVDTERNNATGHFNLAKLWVCGDGSWGRGGELTIYRKQDQLISGLASLCFGFISFRFHCRATEIKKKCKKNNKKKQQHIAEPMQKKENESYFFYCWRTQGYRFLLYHITAYRRYCCCVPRLRRCPFSPLHVVFGFVVVFVFMLVAAVCCYFYYLFTYMADEFYCYKLK